MSFRLPFCTAIADLKPLRYGVHAALALALLGGTGASQAATLHIAAAASMTDAMNEAIEAYAGQHDDLSVVPVYASSSTLARQIANGAPAELYVSANIQWVDWLENQGVTLQERANLLRNRLALIATAGGGDAFVPGEDGRLSERLDEGDRLSVGDPDHVPAGIYAREALESLGEWADLEPRLARGSDVRAALALVERGETPLGIVYQTDANASDRVRTLGLFPADSHAPILYPATLIGDRVSDEAAAFRAWLDGEDAMAIFDAHGFSPAATDSR